MKFSSKEKQRWKQKAEYIKSELKTDRHILACLGSAGITFNDDILRFIEYLILNQKEK